MSYQEKYIKYKSKYLQLVALKKNLEQLGGGRRNLSRNDNSETESVHNFMSLNNLTETPTNNETSEFKKPNPPQQHKTQHNKSKKIKSKNSKYDISEELNSTSSQVSTTDSFDVSSSDIEDS